MREREKRREKRGVGEKGRGKKGGYNAANSSKILDIAGISMIFS